MTSVDPIAAEAIDLLTRGHALFADIDVAEPAIANAPAELGARADAVVRAATADDGMPYAAQRCLGSADHLRGLGDTDQRLAAVLEQARAAHRDGYHGTKVILDAAHADALPAADTPLGRREAARRMAARVRAQRRHVEDARARSHLLAGRLQRLAYPHRNWSGRDGVSSARVIALSDVRYEKLHRPGHVGQWISEALDRMGVHDPQARRNWTMGYETLIGRESSGNPLAVASVPAMAPGPLQPDGHQLGYARGLTQCLPGTFANYHQPGTSTNIYDPVSSICASHNYVMARYHVRFDGSNFMDAVQQADPRRGRAGGY